MNKTTMTLGGILIVQLILFALFSMDTHHVTTKESFLANDTSNINYIKIRNEDGEITLNRVGGTWKITDPYKYPANLSYTKTLMKKLGELEIESTVTSNKSKHSVYELDDSTAAYVEVGDDNGKTTKFYCGKPSDTYTHTYMRFADSDDVLLVSGTPRSSFTRRPKDWRDKAVLAVDATMLEKIVLSFPDERVELVRSISSPMSDSTLVAPDTSWQVIPQRGKPFEPDEKQLNRIMNTLKRLNATDFIDAATKEVPDFSKPELSVQVFLEGDQTDRIDFIPEPDADSDSRYVARKNGDEETLFIVYKSSFKNLSKRSADLVPGKDEDDDS